MISVPEPGSYKQAMGGDQAPEWTEAVKEELAAIEENQVWNLAGLPPGRRAIGARWVFKLKRNEAGEIVRFKARLVAQGFTQREGVDYEDTFAPVANFTTIRTLLALATAQDLELEQMDVTTAFLHGELAEELYLRLPEGYAAPGMEGKVLRLKKGLYGL